MQPESKALLAYLKSSAVYLLLQARTSTTQCTDSAADKLFLPFLMRISALTASSTKWTQQLKRFS
jgi:hypothetical protein